MKLGKEKADSVGTFLKDVDRVFGRYISAKLLQIVIIFLIAQVFFLIIGVVITSYSIHYTKLYDFYLLINHHQLLSLRTLMGKRRVCIFPIV